MIQWYKDAHNVLSIKKLEYHLLKEVLTRHILDISIFKFHIWQKIYYLEPDIKLLRDNMLPGWILGIA